MNKTIFNPGCEFNSWVLLCTVLGPQRQKQCDNDNYDEDNCPNKKKYSINKENSVGIL